MLGKTELLEAIAGKNRGLLASPGDRQMILASVAQLEDRNPTPRPVEATDKLNGNWRLLYTTSQGLLGIDQVPLLKLGQIYQYIQMETAKIYNLAEISGLPYLEGLVSVAANFQPLSERRVKVNFERSIIGLQRLLDYRTADEFIQQIASGDRLKAIDFSISDREQRGWLDITYLDDDLRIGRGNEGSVFVLTKVL
ncbi:MAG: PAP/fibrillin family protein [Oscillatoriophycideae cyanobacterium NC_groundwater_1537_Pr4_S-0.65um_50_18]|nr:PAP/fibrillin family protein [Oscillatoriophycideae cyanobacterium NC_groundwater_1537_Pr4_S-0.65um_50_18]